MTNAPHEVYTCSARISRTTRNFIQTARDNSTVTPAKESCCDGFRIDGLAETILGFRGRLALNTLLYSDMSRAHQDEYYAVFSEPGALTSALNWYRTMQFGRSH